MAGERGREIPSVIQRLLADPRRFDFFEAVRLLERHAQQQAAATCGAGVSPARGSATADSSATGVSPVADERDIRKTTGETPVAPRVPVGRDGDPQREIVRFRAHQSLMFPTSEIEWLGPPGQRRGSQPAAENLLAEDSPPEMFVNFMGLTGSNGVLPRHYTQLLLQRSRGSEALAEFFDLFNHRLISLFYRAWEKYRAAILVEQSRSCPGRAEVDLFTLGLFCLVGMGTGGQRGRMALVDDVFLYYSGCFSHRPANAVSLQAMLIEFLESAVRVCQFHGQWLSLATEDRTRLSPPGRPQTIADQLGRGAVAGERVWDIQSKFRIRVGPVGYSEFCRLMPSGDRLLPLCQFVRTYAGPEWDFDVQLVLRRREVPPCRLDGNARLGWNIWVRSGEIQRDVDDAVFHLAHV